MITLAIIGIAQILSFDPLHQGPCIHANRDTVALRGVLERRTYPGPPNYEDVKKGDAAETGFYLRLQQPICTEHDQSAGPKSNVRLVQLLLDEEGYAALRPSLQKQVTLKGTVFGAYTGHHHAEALLEVLKPVRLVK